MAGKYDFMTPVDRNRKIAESETKRRAWIMTRNRGMARFVLFHQMMRMAAFAIVWDVVFGIYRHASIAVLGKTTVLVLLIGVVSNLLEWYWNEQRYREK